MKPKFKCFDIETVCGRNLRQGVVFVGIASLVISTIVLLSSIVLMVSIKGSDSSYNSQPVVAINLLLALVSAAISCYQIIITVLLLWHSIRITKKYYLCSLWYISHLSILTLYCFLFTSKVMICFRFTHYVTAVITALLGILYEVLFTYFVIIVKAYMRFLDEDRYI